MALLLGVASSLTGGASQLGKKLEEGVERLHKLLANLVFAAFDQMHSDMRLISILECHFRIPYAVNLFCREQTHAVHERKFSHT